MKIVVLIPTLDPGPELCQVIRGCEELGFTRVLVVDDGSSPATRHFFTEAEALGAHVLRHEKNLGKGAALKTGLREIPRLFPDAAGAVTADGDGQHTPADILKIALHTEKNPNAITLGVRDFSGPEVPSRSRFGNRITAGVFYLTTRVRCSDTQTGLRGIPRELMEFVLSLPGDRYEFEMNVLMEAAQRKIPLEMVPIETVYLNENASSHFRVLRDSARIYQRPLKYVAAALSSSLLDLALFTILSLLVFHETREGIWAATVLARCVSGLVNFRLNQIWSFQVKKRTGRQFVRYLLLFFCVMLLSGGLVGLCRFLPIPLTLSKIVVDTVLFLANYQIQRRWVFREPQ